jgi:hypothetical protein
VALPGLGQPDPFVVSEMPKVKMSCCEWSFTSAGRTGPSPRPMSMIANRTFPFLPALRSFAIRFAMPSTMSLATSAVCRAKLPFGDITSPASGSGR